MIKPLQPGFARGKTGQPPFRAREIPLWWLVPPPSPHFVVGLWMLSHGAMSLQESIEQFILPPLAGNAIKLREKRAKYVF